MRLICCSCRLKFFQRELLLLKGLLKLLGFFLLDVLLHFVDQREHIAHAENARGQPVGIKRLESVELFADAGK